MSVNNGDFVLVWESNTQNDQSKREIFEKNLKKDGLILEILSNNEGKVGFISIHTPLNVLRTYADILGIQLPMRKTPEMTSSVFNPINKSTFFCKFFKYLEYNREKLPKKSSTEFDGVYSREKEYLFSISGSTSFPPGVRSRVVDFILKRTSYSENDQLHQVGIDKLLTEKVYSAAYPLHDGRLTSGTGRRCLLRSEWGSLQKFYKYQPLEAVREYLGDRVAFYFAWLGYYTQMLIPASIFGIFCFIYGLSTLYSNKYSEQICNSESFEPMCPLCNKYCNYWNLKDTCFYARLTQSLDNEATVLFSVLMAFWSVLFLEFWKRYAFELSCRWDVSGKIQEEEYPRPDYLARLRGVKKQELNVVTRTVEPVLSFWKKKFPNTLFSISMVLLLSSLAVSAVVAVILYRISITVVIFTQWAEYDPRVHSWGLILVHGTAVLINLLFIHFFDWLYTFLAEYLTTIELHRTQSEYDESLTLKIFLLKFINFYSSLFYIAFFKGKFVGTPQKYKYFFGYRNEECGGSGGCMTELSIQLVSVMIVKQGLNAVLEMVAPFLKRFWKEKRHHRKDKKITSINTQWERDYNLLDWSSRTLVPEYLEMVIQFGFITIFVSAFPLAPLFALLNNIFEMRLDAQKLLKYYRRPISSHVSNIGVWFPILDSLVKLSVISNSFIIAFTSNFIPKFVYRAERGTLDGFLSYVSHRFNISDFPIESAPITTYGNISVCIYQSFEDIPHDKGQGYINFYWKVLMARLAFIVVFQNVVFCCSLLLNWLIPDVPRKLKIKIRQRDHIIKEYNIKQERKKSIQPTTTHCSNTLMTIDDECCWLESIL